MERQAALLFFGLYAVRYCVLKHFFKKGNSSLLEESSIQANHTVLCQCGQQKLCGCNLKFSSTQETGLSPLSLLGNYSRNLEELLRPDAMKKRSESLYTLLERPGGWWAPDLHSLCRGHAVPLWPRQRKPSFRLKWLYVAPHPCPWSSPGATLYLYFLSQYIAMHFPQAVSGSQLSGDEIHLANTGHQHQLNSC